MAKQDIYVIEFKEGEMALLLDIIQYQVKTSQHYPDYWQRLHDNLTNQVNYQLQNQPFRCAVCALRSKIRDEINSISNL